MIKSMTGFCKTEVLYKELRCYVEVRSVNHRFLESRIFLPKQFQYLEDSLKKALKLKLNRGKVDVSFQLSEENSLEEKLSVDTNVWENVKSIVGLLEKDIGRDLQVNMSDLLAVKGLLAYQQEEKDAEDYETLFGMALNQGAEELITMRQREGELLYQDITSHVNSLQELINKVPAFQKEVSESFRQRLATNLENLHVKYDKDDPRILQEVGIFMDRADITEEIERFNTHLVQMRELLAGDEPVGRKLDFILQELHREANTLCSKAAHIQVTQVGVDLKCDIEKIREQVQNIE
jgi:uncharacterized protein (TIGR00255 family)